jgi:hypothetical protein
MLAQGFLDHPNDDKLLMLLQRFSGSIGLGALYDHRVDSYSDPLISEFSFVLEGKLALLQPGASFYDYLPWFRNAPDWVMPSKKRARAARDKGEVLDLKMSKMVQERVNEGEDGSASFHSGLLEREREGKAELTPFERDSLSGSEWYSPSERVADLPISTSRSGRRHHYGGHAQRCVRIHQVSRRPEEASSRDRRRRRARAHAQRPRPTAAPIHESFRPGGPSVAIGRALLASPRNVRS